MIGRSIPRSSRMRRFGQRVVSGSCFGPGRAPPRSNGSIQYSPMAGMLSTVDVEDFASDEMSGVEVEHGLDDLIDRAHALHRMKRGKKVISLGMVHRRLDDARRYRVHPDALVRILDCKRSRRRIDAALGQ